jgi:hypothetical protein
MRTFSVLAISAFILLFSCKKERFITSKGASVSISADTLKYDTVFTRTGSVTQSFKIINNNNQKLRLSSVKLMGGDSSFFKINVDGQPGPEANNLELAANDSLYVFVQVTINPNSANLPFVVRDSIRINFNGNSNFVQLEAWGQNAHFLQNKTILGNETWNNDLPYVILGYLHINDNATLTINKGCRIFMHADAPILVDGTMLVNGDKDSTNRVYFRGDRLDDPYKDYPASWPGILFNTNSTNNIFNYSVIKNAYQAVALQDPSANANPKLILNQCIIDNAYDAGIISLNSSINAVNCLISNCGKNIVLAKGGNYSFTHCTVAAYSNNFILHKDPVLYAGNFINVNNVPVFADLNAVFRNCIFWGDGGTVDDEVVVAQNSSAAFNINFDHVLWKVKNNPAGVTATNIINNIPPGFDTINIAKNLYNFRLANGSPALDDGVNTSVTVDLDGNPRPVGLPDLGCYEKQ